MGTKKRCLVAKALKAERRKELEQVQPAEALQQFADYLNAKIGKRLPKNEALEQAAQLMTFLVASDGIPAANYSDKVIKLFNDAFASCFEYSVERQRRFYNLALNYAYELGKAAAENTAKGSQKEKASAGKAGAGKTSAGGGCDGGRGAACSGCGCDGSGGGCACSASGVLVDGTSAENGARV